LEKEHSENLNKQKNLTTLLAQKVPGIQVLQKKHRIEHTHGLENPADGPVTSTANDLEVLDILEHLQALHGTADGEVVHLSGIENVLEFPEHAFALATAGLWIYEDQ
jgi:hypothetical protein